MASSSSSATKTLLDQLRAQSKVDCDTLDYKVAEALGPFNDCTSNQAIAYGELQKPDNETLVAESIQLAKECHGKFNDAATAASSSSSSSLSFEQLATEIMMVKLSSRVVKHLTGFAHIQTYPYYAYSKAKTIANAERIVAIFKLVNPEFPSSRICIKIPSTYEGLSACRELEARGIATLATTLFSMEQAALAADAGCTYIAPYVNELAVHFVAGHVDGDKGFALCRSAQRYYARIAAKTQVLPASLTSTAEVMRLAGVHHITVSPRLLAELAATPAVLASATVVDTPSTWFSEHDADDASPVDYSHVVRDEDAYRMAYTRSKGGENERKLASAINIFADMQDRMEELVRLRLG